MENFAIMTDAGGDFTRETIQKYGIEETPLSKVVWPDGSEREADLYYDSIKPSEYQKGEPVSVTPDHDLKSRNFEIFP